MKNESFRRSFSMLCAAVGLIVLMGIAVAGQMESTEQQNQKLLSENQKLTEENENSAHPSLPLGKIAIHF